VLNANPTALATGFPGSVQDVAISLFTIPEPSVLAWGALSVFVGQFSFRRKRAKA